MDDATKEKTSRATMVFENRQSHTVEFVLEPMGWVWDMEPSAVFELEVDKPLTRRPGLYVLLKDNTLIVGDEEEIAVIVRKNGEVLLDYTAPPARKRQKESNTAAAQQSA